MRRRQVTLSFALLAAVLLIALVPSPASSGLLPGSLQPSPTLLGPNSTGTGNAPGFAVPGWITDTMGSSPDVLDVLDVEPAPRGNPKMGASLNQLLRAFRGSGLMGAQDFAAQHLMRLDAHRVQVQVTVAQEAMAGIRRTIESLGGEYQGHYRTLLQALVPIDALESLAGHPDVWFLREPQRAMPDEPMLLGAETTAGVVASNASAWHAAGYDGRGVKIAVIDGDFQGYRALLGTELPAIVHTRDYTGAGMEGDSVHGTACAEIVHDMAPAATLYLYKVDTPVDLANAVTDLIAEGVDIISMSLSWRLDGPGDGTGYLADIVNDARAHGIFWATSAGNYAEQFWSGLYDDSGDGSHEWEPGSNVNCFAREENGACLFLREDVPIYFALHWDDWTRVTQDYDLLLVYNTGSGWQLLGRSEDPQNGGTGQAPQEYIGIRTPYEAAYGAVVVRKNATRDVCLRLRAGPLDLKFRVESRSLGFPGDSPDAITVGAVDATSPPIYPLEPYSSQGPTFGPGGACSGGSVKPDIASYANVATASYGGTDFNGTSAACPHVAGAAAVVKQAHASFTVAELQNYLESRAIDLGPTGKDNMYGSGRLYLGPPEAAPTHTPTVTSTPTATRGPPLEQRIYLPIIAKNAQLGPEPTHTPRDTPTFTPTPTDSGIATPTTTATPTATGRPTMTGTPTEMPTVTATPPTGIDVYFDDFSDPNSGWPEEDDPNWSVGYLGGEYRFLMKSPSSPGSLWFGWVVAPSLSCVDCAVEVDARYAASNYGVYGLIFGVTEAWDLYAFLVDERGYYAIVVRTDNRWYGLVDWTASPHINRGQSSNQLRIVRSGNEIKAYINGQFVATVRDDSLMGLLRAGLIVGVSDIPDVDVRFDNFRATASGGPDDFGYVYDSRAPFSWVDTSGGAVVPGGDDFCRGPYPIGFAFNFYGKDYTRFSVSTNGFVLLGDNCQGGGAFVNAAIPNSTFPNGIIAPFWDDLKPVSGAVIRYEIFGSAPNRYLVVEWNGVGLYTDFNHPVTFQAILYEGTNDIRFQYLRMVHNQYGDGSSATVGIEDDRGRIGLSYSYDRSSIRDGHAIHFLYPR